MKTFWISVLVLVLLFGGFMTTSLCLANNNDRTLKEEWKSWFTAEEVVENEDSEDLEEDIVVEETAEEIAA